MFQAGGGAAAAVAQAQHHLGKALGEVDETAGAVVYLREAVRLNPGDAEAWFDLAGRLKEQNRVDEALSALERVLELDKDHSDAPGARGLLLLVKGDLERGWREYERRWEARNFPEKRPDLDRPLWRGEPMAGRTLLLWTEQGNGDTIQFVRYAALLAEQGVRVVLQCPSDLAPLMKSVRGIERVVMKGAALPPFDAYCPLLSVPLAMGTRLETIPAQVPYISAEPQRVAKWRERLQVCEGRLKVGLAWSGSPQHVNDRRRSCPLRLLAPLAQVEGVTLVSLQKGPGSAQAVPPPAGMKLVNLTAGIGDFADTAALVANLDLVITVDTAVAHLAGAMGKAVWTLLPFVPDWRWMLGREDSPWYPTMRLFRQAEAGDWASAIRRVWERLAEAAGGN